MSCSYFDSNGYTHYLPSKTHIHFIPFKQASLTNVQLHLELKMNINSVHDFYPSNTNSQLAVDLYCGFTRFGSGAGHSGYLISDLDIAMASLKLFRRLPEFNSVRLVSSVPCPFSIHYYLLFHLTLYNYAEIASLHNQRISKKYHVVREHSNYVW
jgi:hypothetical protein